jgi:hypothetical protein
MRDQDVEIGGVYAVKIGGWAVPVRILSWSSMGCWYGENLWTRRRVWIPASQLLYRVDGGGNDGGRA